MAEGGDLNGWMRERGMLTINITTREPRPGDPPAKCRCEQMTPSKLAAAKPRNFYYFDFKHAHKSQDTGRKTLGYCSVLSAVANGVISSLKVRQWLFCPG